MTVRRLTIGALIAAACLLATFALPVPTWRTGRLPVPPLPLATWDGDALPPSRLWIDTDAACGASARTDVDDCLALWLVATRLDAAVAGISTVAGNASIDVTDRTTRTLVGLLGVGADNRYVHRGAAGPFTPGAPVATPASAAIVRALEEGPAVILALGPLTNVATALERRPDLRGRVERLIAVMGRRSGHLFHPAEGAGRGMLFGHGPVFRDVNFAVDPDAVRAVVAMGVPLTLVPYDAARHIEIDADALDRLAARGAAGRWIAQRSRGWLEYWQIDIGRSGFYPFDLLAAAHLVEPRLFRCGEVHAAVRKDPLAFFPSLQPEALLVDPPPASTAPNALYCPAVDGTMSDRIAEWFEGSADANRISMDVPCCTAGSRSSAPS